MRWAFAVTLALLLAPPAVAQGAPERELELVKALFDAGKYAETVALVRKATATTNFTDAQRLELLKMSGLAAFNLGEAASAKEGFLALLRINPDYVLDPFVAPPPAIRLFEQVRKDNADELTLVRQLLQVRAEQERKAAEERRRQEGERASRRVIIIERRPLWMNFLPFGAGQFLQDRTALGITFAVAEGVLGIASIVAFWAIESLKVTITDRLADTLTPTGDFERTVRGIPPSLEQVRNNWRLVRWTTGGAFYVAWAAGVVDALVHHTGDRVKESRDEPGAQPPRVSLTPLPGGGLFAGMTVAF